MCCLNIRLIYVFSKGCVRKLTGKPLWVQASRERRDEDETKTEHLKFAEHFEIISETANNCAAADDVREDGDSIGSISNLKRKVPVLGQRSYWLESAIPAVQERQRLEEQKFNALRIKPSLHRTTPAPIKENSEELRVRRDRFMHELERQRERQNIIRDEDSLEVGDDHHHH